MGPLNRVNGSSPLNTRNASEESASGDRQIVTSIRGLTKKGAPLPVRGRRHVL